MLFLPPLISHCSIDRAAFEPRTPVFIGHPSVYWLSSPCPVLTTLIGRNERSARRRLCEKGTERNGTWTCLLNRPIDLPCEITGYPFLPRYLFRYWQHVNNAWPRITCPEYKWISLFSFHPIQLDLSGDGLFLSGNVNENYVKINVILIIKSAQPVWKKFFVF